MMYQAGLVVVFLFVSIVFLCFIGEIGFYLFAKIFGVIDNYIQNIKTK